MTFSSSEMFMKVIIFCNSNSKQEKFSGKIDSANISFDSKYFVTASQDKSIKIFDIESKQQVHQFSAPEDDCNHKPFSLQILTKFLRLYS